MPPRTGSGTLLLDWSLTLTSVLEAVTVTWRGVIGRVNLNPSGTRYSVLDFCAGHGLSITNTMFEHKDLVPEHPQPEVDDVSSDLRPHVLDTRVKRGTEVSTDHHLLVSWIEWQGESLDRPGKPKRVAGDLETSGGSPCPGGPFNSHPSC